MMKHIILFESFENENISDDTRNSVGDKEFLPVIFRAEVSGKFKGDITAVFPTLPGTIDPYTATGYAHVGQHTTVSKDWYETTRAATPEEYVDLFNELKGIYETGDDAVQLVVAQKWTSYHDNARKEALNSMK